MKKKDWISDVKQHIDRVLTKRNQFIIFLFTIIMIAASIYAAITHVFPEPVSITLYVFAAAGFVCNCTLWIKAIIFFVRFVLMLFTRNNRIASTLIKDTRLRTVLTTVPGMGFNLIYAVFNGAVGIISHSAWCGSLAAYYMLLCAMRFLSVSYARKIYDGKLKILLKKIKMNKRNNNRDVDEGSLEIRAWKVYRNCGIMLSVSSFALGGTVIVLVSGQGGKSYPGLMIYAVATYTFYKLTMAVINMVKARKENSLLLTTLRNINYADALVSLLSLQTAMFAAFGQNSGEMIPVTNALAGAGACIMIFVLGVYMVRRAGRYNKDF